jgi:hypothetical protein
MKLEFRSADGRVCCSSDNPDNLCRDCRTRLRINNLKKLRANENYAPPDPYAPSEPSAPPRSSNKFSPPDPYAAGIAELRSANGN